MVTAFSLHSLSSSIERGYLSLADGCAFRAINTFALIPLDLSLLYYAACGPFRKCEKQTTEIIAICAGRRC
jgi:hypothetical protein